MLRPNFLDFRLVSAAVVVVVVVDVDAAADPAAGAGDVACLESVLLCLDMGKMFRFVSFVEEHKKRKYI